MAYGMALACFNNISHQLTELTTSSHRKIDTILVRNQPTPIDICKELANISHQTSLAADMVAEKAGETAAYRAYKHQLITTLTKFGATLPV
jgi:hypothetical protein